MLDLRTPGGSYDEVFLSLHGAHQGTNASIALAAAEAFFGRPLDPDAGGRGVRRRQQPGPLRGRPARPAARPRRRPQPRRRPRGRSRPWPRASWSPATPARRSGCSTGATRWSSSRSSMPPRPPRSCAAPPTRRARCPPPRSPSTSVPSAARRGWSPTSTTPSSAALAAADADDVVLVTGSLYTVGPPRLPPPRSPASPLTPPVLWRPPSQAVICAHRWRRVARSRVASGAMNQTFVMCKPDAVERGLVGEIVSRLERKGFTLVAAELRSSTRPSPRSTTPSTPTSRSSGSWSPSSPARRCSP